jgi:hypothetical protein
LAVPRKPSGPDGEAPPNGGTEVAQGRAEFARRLANAGYARGFKRRARDGLRQVKLEVAGDTLRDLAAAGFMSDHDYRSDSIAAAIGLALRDWAILRRANQKE